MGAGGHAKVVIDAALASGWDLAQICVLDDAPDRAGASVMGLRIATPAIPETVDTVFHVAIGKCDARGSLHDRAVRNGGRPVTIIHPRAVISPSAKIGAGSFVAAGAIVGPEGSCGIGTILNHASIMDHDCRVGDFCHIAPGATLGGHVVVENNVLVGAGSVVLPGLTVGRGATIGAGAVVTRNVPPGQVWIGAPAREQGDRRAG